MNYYERHLGDYARDTGHLTLLEHGVYTRLMDRYYATEEGVAAEQIFRICGARTKEEKLAVESVVSEFFSLEDGVYKHGRIEGEIEKARARIGSARDNGRKGGRPKKNPPGYETETHEKPNGLLLGYEIETGLKALHAPSSNLQSPEDQKQTTSLSTSEPLTDLLGAATAEPASLDQRRSERLATVTEDAIGAYNRILGKPNGLLKSVRPGVGKDARREQVRRCLKTAAEICLDQYGDSRITPAFWEAYFATASEDAFSSGRGNYAPPHENWRPDFDYLTKRKTMLKLFERAVGDDAEEAA